MVRATPLRPYCSSGSSGKISIFPRSEVEQSFVGKSYCLPRYAFRDEPGFKNIDDAKSAPLIIPSVRNGSHSGNRILDAVRDHFYGGREEMIVSLGGEMSTDMLWLSSRLQAAEARGELNQIRLSPALTKIRDQLMEQRSQAPQHLEAFWENVIQTYRGKRVCFFSPWQRYLQMVDFMKQRNLRLEFSKDSLFLCGGGIKGFVLPEGWKEKLKQGIPKPIKEFYGMTEMGAGTIVRCVNGNYHIPPWTVPFILNPDTSEPYPRTGTQTGRFAFFDLSAETYWGGFITGDEMTYVWDGGCSCGRNGPYVLGDVTRYSDQRADDKITCLKAPDLYDKASDFLMNLT